MRKAYLFEELVAGSRLWAGIGSKDDRSSRQEFTIRSTQESNHLYEAGVRIIIGDENPCNHGWHTVLGKSLWFVNPFGLVNPNEHYTMLRYIHRKITVEVSEVFMLPQIPHGRVFTQPEIRKRN